MSSEGNRLRLVDLKEESGLPVSLDLDSGRLSAGSTVHLPTPGIRTVGELIPVWADPDKASGRKTEPAYLTYRDVRLVGDSWLDEQRLRYDITVTLPGTIGAEFMKTAGHYHALAPDGVADLEVYDVLHGQAAFLLQLVDDPESPLPGVHQLWIVRSGPGDRVVIPPDSGHVTVNTGSEPLAVADLVAKRSRNLYDGIRALRGAAVFVLHDSSASEGVRLEENPRYGGIPEPVLLTGSRCEPLIPQSPPIYQLAKSDPAALAFLTRPSIARQALPAIYEHPAESA